jgi:outer membrane lipoprotein-sorting protein
VNRFLRNAPTARLLGMIAGLVAAVALGTTIAIAAQGSGPVPPRKPLAAAIHQALAAPAVKALSARINFTNNLISSSEVQGSDPLLSGASGRVWMTQDALRLELQGDNGDANVVVRNGNFWAYDPSSNTVYEGKLPARAARKATAKHEAIPTLTQIQRQLNRLMAHLSLSGAIPSDVAGRAAYTVRVSPKTSGGLIGAVQLAWDAARGVPLRLALYARGDSRPVLSLEATDIGYGSVPNSVFAISPPAGAKVETVQTPSAAGADHWAKPHLSFALVAPAELAGMKRRSITQLGSDGAVVGYGEGPGGITVIEHAATPGSAKLATEPEGDQAGLSLPTVSLHGTTGQELDTAIGTVVRFVRGGVAFTVIGSVKPAVADAAARDL